MADKATLLDEIPPVAKGSSSGEAPQGVSVTAADQEISITAFQAMTYGSFVLTFVLAGFAGVVLYRKAIGDIEQRIVRSAKTLALVMALMALHGFAATYLYTLISLPPLVPLFSIFHVVGLLGPDLTLFLLNAVSFTFVSYISFAMLTRIKHPIENQSNQAIQPSAAAAAETPGEPATKTAMDPLVAELLAEQDAMPQEEPVPLETPGVIPPEKPDRPRAKPEAPEEKRQAADKNRQQSEAPQEPGKPKKSVEEANQGSVLKVNPPFIILRL